MQALFTTIRQRYYNGSITEGAASLDPTVRDALAEEMGHTFVFDGLSTASSDARSATETMELVEEALKDSKEKLEQYESTEQFLADRIGSYNKQLGGLRQHLVQQLKTLVEGDSKMPAVTKTPEESTVEGAQSCVMDSLTDAVCGQTDKAYDEEIQKMQLERQQAHEEEKLLESFLDDETQFDEETANSLRTKILKYQSHRQALLKVEESHDETLVNIRKLQRRTILLERVHNDLQTKKRECQEFLLAAESLARRDHRQEEDLTLFSDEDGLEMGTLQSSNNETQLKSSPTKESGAEINAAP